MSDVSQGPGWWQASDGKWYPPKESERPPAPGWWLAADGRWYPPVETAQPPAPGWWLAADGRWYPPTDDATSTPGGAPSFEPTPIDLSQLPPEPEPEPEPVIEPEPEPVIELAADPDPEPEPEPASVPEPVAAPSAAPPVPAEASKARTNGGTARPPRRIEDAPSRAAAPPASPEDQIRQRDQASRQDAVALAPARFLAASRALKLLGEPDEPAAPARSSTPTKTSAAPAAPPPARPVPAPAPSSIPAERPSPAPDVSSSPAAAVSGTGDTPLIELRTSPLGADIDHLGDRLLVFTDRVELRDRDDRVRQTLVGAEIADVVIQRKFTGAVLTVEAHDGDSIVTRGIKPEQADEARALIHQHPRDSRPPEPSSDAVTGPAATSPAGAPVGVATSPDAVEAAAARLAILNRDRLNEADLLRKLADLHRAGVLTDAEFEEKIALVGRLVSGESRAIS